MSKEKVFTCAKVALERSGSPDKPGIITGVGKTLTPYVKNQFQENIDTFNEQQHNSGQLLMKIGYEYKLTDVEVSKGRKIPAYLEKGPLPKKELTALLVKIVKEDTEQVLIHLANHLLELGATNPKAKKEENPEPENPEPVDLSKKKPNGFRHNGFVIGR